MRIVKDSSPVGHGILRKLICKQELKYRYRLLNGETWSRFPVFRAWARKFSGIFLSMKSKKNCKKGPKVNETTKFAEELHLSGQDSEFAQKDAAGVNCQKSGEKHLSDRTDGCGWMPGWKRETDDCHKADRTLTPRPVWGMQFFSEQMIDWGIRGTPYYRLFIKNM